MDFAAIAEPIAGICFILHGLGMLWFRWGAPRADVRKYFLARWQLGGRPSRSRFTLLVQAAASTCFGIVIVANHYTEIDRKPALIVLIVLVILLWGARIRDLRSDDF